jgi:hypothetical protein
MAKANGFIEGWVDPMRARMVRGWAAHHRKGGGKAVTIRPHVKNS